ncbi:phosphopantetheine-binding protein [Treponema sp.]|uniref:phosphopantetheine-binding protein n=1 Tax=Treponema sp. TaxID=166 RepID=UPI003F010ACD
MNELIEILQEMKPDVDFSKENALIDNAILDSFDIVQLVMKLNEEFDIEIGAEEIVPANFNSAESMLKMIERLRD